MPKEEDKKTQMKHKLIYQSTLQRFSFSITTNSLGKEVGKVKRERGQLNLNITNTNRKEIPKPKWGHVCTQFFFFYDPKNT